MKFVNFAILPYFVINMSSNEFSDFNIVFSQTAFLGFIIGGGAYKVYSSELINFAEKNTELTLSLCIILWGIFSTLLLFILLYVLQAPIVPKIFYNETNQNIYHYMSLTAAFFTSITLLIYVRIQLDGNWRKLLLLIIVKNALATILSALVIMMYKNEIDSVIVRLGTIITCEVLVVIIYFDVAKRLFIIYDLKSFPLFIDRKVVLRLCKYLPITILAGAIPYAEKITVSAFLSSKDFRDYAIALQILSPLTLIIGSANQVKIRFLMARNTLVQDFYYYLRVVLVGALVFLCFAYLLAEVMANYIDGTVNLPRMLLLFSPLVIVQICVQIVATRGIGLGYDNGVFICYFLIISYLVIARFLFTELVLFILVNFLLYVVCTLVFLKVKN